MRMAIFQLPIYVLRQLQVLFYQILLFLFLLISH